MYAKNRIFFFPWQLKGQREEKQQQRKKTYNEVLKWFCSSFCCLFQLFENVFKI